MHTIKTQLINVKGMHCPGCESAIEKAVCRLAGVRRAKADYGAETLDVSFDRNKVTLFQILSAVELAGYEGALTSNAHPWRDTLIKLTEILLGLAGIALIFAAGAWLDVRERLPAIGQHLSHGMIFIVGLLTGFHCVGMCGGFIVGYTTRGALKGKPHGLSHVAYGFGKTVSYTVIGAAFGYLGSIITFTPQIRSATAVIAGAFLVLFGLNMLHLMPHWRWFGIRTPGFLARFVSQESRKHKSPFAIGMLNGLMLACGPLQAMYVMAAGTGSMLEGATILLLFGAGTLPLLMGFGLLASVLSRRATNSILKVSAVLVVSLGLIMLNRGLVLNGSGYDFSSLLAAASAKIEFLAKTYAPSLEEESGVQFIRMEVNRKGFVPNRFVLRQGVPVKWVILGTELNECNRSIIVPKLGLSFDVRQGEQIIEFTPLEAGVIPWSCWMGMIPGTFVIQAEPAPDLSR